MAELLREAIQQKSRARLLMATGASQFETIEHLRKQNMDWSKVELFHLDEYIGIAQNHPASFVNYLRTRFGRDDIPLAAAYFFNGLKDPAQSIADMTAALREAPIDAALVGIGENGHIAFNDPPADFTTTESFIIVTLDDACKRQQIREGWYANMDEVPKQAVSMTVHEILQCRAIVSAVPHDQKAEAVRNTLGNEPTPDIPATALKTHPNWTLYLDKASASLI